MRSIQVRLQRCLSVCFKLIIVQVAVKTFQMYAHDQYGSAKTRKIRVSVLTSA